MRKRKSNITKIAARAGCTYQMFWYITKGLKRPSPQLAKRLEEATGISREAWLWPREYKNPMVSLANKG